MPNLKFNVQLVHWTSPASPLDSLCQTCSPKKLDKGRKMETCPRCGSSDVHLDQEFKFYWCQDCKSSWAYDEYDLPEDTDLIDR